ncbi:MAG: hypothetical protein R2873_21295 [Caldilineaceae bacterium]
MALDSANSTRNCAPGIGAARKRRQRRRASAPSEPNAESDTGTFSPYIVAIPGSGLNGASLTVSAGGVSGLASPVFVIADDGPTSDKHSHSMTLDSATGIYRHTFEGFFDSAGQISGSVEVTTTVGVSETVTSGVRSYERWAVDCAKPEEIYSPVAISISSSTPAASPPI